MDTEKRKEHLQTFITEGQKLLTQVVVSRTMDGFDELFREDIYDVPVEYAFKDYCDYEKYNLWIKKVIRFLDINYKNESLANEFVQESRKELCDNRLSNMIYILKTYKDTLDYTAKKQPQSEQTSPQVINNIYNHNEQSQHQSQEITVNFLFEAIAKGLTSEQKDEIKEIIESEKNPETIKTKIVKKLKNFGENVAANMVANLATNPNMWASLLTLM